MLNVRGSTAPLIITCPIVGAELTRKDTRHLPLAPDELAEAARGAVEAGATVIHLHVRDEEGRPTQRVEVFEEVAEKIRERCDCILQFSTGGAVGTPLAERIAPLQLRPEMASLSMGTMNFGAGIFENSEGTIRAILQAIRDYAVTPELEIFDLGMMETALRLLRNGELPEKFHVNFMLGVPGGMGGDLLNLLFLVDRLPAGQAWSVGGVGRFQLPLAAHAVALGGHARVGFEDNIYYRKGELAESNAQLVKRTVRLARELDRPIAAVEEARKILKLSPARQNP